MTDHDRQAESVGAHALGALPELEARLFERHLMGCEVCREELQGLETATDALARSVTPYVPPPAVKQRLMHAVGETRAARAGEVRSQRRWIPRLKLHSIGVLAAACVALAFVAGTKLGAGGGDEARAVAAKVDRTRLPNASARLVVPGGDERGALLRVEGLPDPGRGRVYEVWVRRDGAVVPVSIFEVDSSGSGAAAIPTSLEGAYTVLVTRERRGGAQTPTETPAITVDL